MNIYTIVFGIIAVIAVAAIASTYLFNKVPAAAQNITTVSSLKDYGKAPNIVGISGWINSQPLNLTQLKGKVVLIDFWTYSCINCIRTIPFLNGLNQEYGKDGLVIIGVSTPEFQFEHNYTNVLNAVKRFGIQYPVALDNNYSTWTAYNNEYWPADYLINSSGYIKYEAFGEADFNTTQQVIRLLLQNAGYNVSPGLVNFTDPANFSQIGTPEIYLGYDKAREPLGNLPGFVPNTTVNYAINNISEGNLVYLQGEWYDAPEYIESEGNSSALVLVYQAKDVNIVASGNSSLEVFLDGAPLNQSYLGSDARLVNGSAVVRINSSRLYNLVAAPSYGIHEIEIKANPGIQIYTFTFG